MKSKPKTLSRESRILFTIVGGAVLLNPVFAAEKPADELEEVVVTGLRGSLKAAMDIKRDAVGVVDAISAEDIGKFPDSNLSEALQRITGISINRRNGEGALVTARGFGAEYNMVTLNGRSMPTADAYAGRGGTTRSFDFSSLAAEAISGIEVYKTSRANIASGGIGATVNVKTAKPLDNPGTVANFGVKATTDTSNREGSDITPELSGIFSWANDSRNFGVGVNASYQERNSGAAMSTVNDWRIYTWDPVIANNASTAPLHRTAGVVDAVIVNPPAAGQLYGIPNDIRYHFSDRHRERINAQAVVQFAPVETLVLTADLTYAENNLKEDRGDQTLWMNRNGYTRIEFDRGQAVATPTLLREDTGNNKDFGYEQQHREQTNYLRSRGFNAAWKVTDNFDLTLDLHDSTAASKPSDGVTGGGETTFSLAGTTPSFTVQQFQFNKGLPIAGRIINGNSNLTFTPAQLGSQVLRVNYQDQVTEMTQARLDGALKFDAGWAGLDEGKVQFGVETRALDMTQHGSENFMTLGNWGVARPGEIPTSLLTPFSLVNQFEDYATAGAPVDGWKGNANDLAAWAVKNPNYGVWRDPTGTRGVLGYNPGFSQNNRVEEDIDAGYLQVSFKGDLGSMPMNLLLGARYEKTKVTSTSTLLKPLLIGWEDDNDFYVTRETALTPYAQKADYDHLLPSLDFDLELMEGLKARASYSKTIARAQYDQLRSSVSVGTPQGSTLTGNRPNATGSNPALVPLESDNYDLSLEWYFDSNSYVAAGYFQKRVDNFIGNSVVQENLFGIRDQTGGPRALAARAALQSAGYTIDDARLFTMMALIEHPTDATYPGGAAAYNGLDSQHVLMASRYDLLPVAADPLYTFNVTRPVNNHKAKIDGFEFAGQHFFGDSGFGIQANYTIVNGDVAFNNAGTPTVDQFALLGLSDSANVVLMYEKYGFTMRLAWNWRDQYLQAANRGGWRNPEYVEAYQQFDISMGYNVNDHLSVTFEGLNLTEENVRVHGRSPLQMWSVEDLGSRYMLGARYKF